MVELVDALASLQAATTLSPGTGTPHGDVLDIKAGDSTDGYGGDLNLSGGDAGGGAGGVVNINGGVPLTDLGNGNSGGAVYLQGGVGESGGGIGGEVIAYGGNSPDDAPGNVELHAGFATAGAHKGGDVVLKSGISDGANGGDIRLQLLGGGAGFGNIFLEGIPTVDPLVANAVWNDAGTLKISAG